MFSTQPSTLSTTATAYCRVDALGTAFVTQAPCFNSSVTACCRADAVSTVLKSQRAGEREGKEENHYTPGPSARFCHLPPKRCPADLRRGPELVPQPATEQMLLPPYFVHKPRACAQPATEQLPWAPCFPHKPCARAGVLQPATMQTHLAPVVGMAHVMAMH